MFFLSYIIRRPTSVFKRVESEGRQAKKSQDQDVYKNPSYQYHEFDQLDYPHYVPRKIIKTFAIVRNNNVDVTKLQLKKSSWAKVKKLYIFRKKPWAIHSP